MSAHVGRTTVVYFVSQAGGSLAGFLATWFIANQLGGSVLGEYSVVVAILFWLTVPAKAVAKAVNKRLSETGEIRPYLGAGQLFTVAVSLVLIAGILLAGEQVNALANGRPVAAFLAMLVVAKSLFDVTLGALRGNKQVGISGFVKTGERVIRSAFQIGAILASAGFVWLVIGHTASLILAALWGAVALWKLPSLPTRDHLFGIYEYSKYSWLGTMKTQAFAWMDTLFLGAFAAYSLFGTVVVTHTQIGIYEASWSLASTLGLLSISITQTLFPEISNLSADRRFTRIRSLLDDGLAFTGLFAIPGVVGAALIGGDLLQIYRPEFARGKWILVILVGARLLSSYNTQLLNAINAVDRPDIAFRINLVFLLFNLVANVLLISFLGWHGAALATLLSAGVSLLVGSVALNRIIGGVPVPVRPIGEQVGAATMMGLVLLGLRSALPSGAVAGLLLVAVGATIYAIALLGLSSRFRNKVRLITGV